MAKHGFDISDTAQNGTSPSGIGNKVAADILAVRHSDGANQLGDEPGTNPTTDGLPNYYADYDKGSYHHYVPVNEPIFVEAFTSRAQIKDLTRWQPLRYLDATNTLQTPGYIGPHWENVRPFALSAAAQFRPGAPITNPNKQAFVDQARHVIEIQANLDEMTMGIAEFWADGPKSSLPPGHWFDHGIWTSKRDDLSLDDTVKLMFAVANAVFDASIAVWEAKRHYDYARPITAIRYLFNEAMIPGWRGTGRGFGQVQGATWRPFQKSTFPTPPFPEYVSGHSGFSAAAAEVLKRFTGSDLFNRTDTISAPLGAEPTVPTRVLYLHWSTFSDAAQQAGDSRLFGGIHFYEGNMAGLALGRHVGAQAFDHAEGYWQGTTGH